MSEDKIKSIIVDKLGVEENKITADADFINDLGADSLDQVELIMQLEEEFNIEISDEEAESLTTVGKVYDFLKDK
ncbi:MAG: acyl carrier protein [Candidatus Marinimicrobia bacterium]|nr:acyl carrier protein [Candidatus Neomarinimicrobiota bacterium]|tara:strand:- start:1860 stop:2084 length:225 start_codon:yes stop_codon:yes gene_type:complete